MKKIYLLFFIFNFSLVTLCAQTISTVIGNGIPGYTGDGGQATAAELYMPCGITMDTHGNIFIADYYNNVVRKVSNTGIITTVAGNGYLAGTGNGGYSGDGGAATAAELYGPCSVALDTGGNLYIADLFNSIIRKVNLSGIITTIAGNGTGSYSGDGGPATASELYFPMSLSFDTSNNLYIADSYNGRIRKVNTLGIISTFAGNGSGCNTGDGGPATSAGICSPDFISFDAVGNLYISADNSNTIRKVNKAGTITTIAGNGNAGYTGNGGAATSAELDDPDGATFDGYGNIYIADEINDVIRMVSTSGIISTIAGDGYEAGFSGGYCGDGGPATAAELYYPINPIFVSPDNLYFTDADNNRVRKLTGIAMGIQNPTTVSNSDVSIFPNPSNGTFTIELENVSNEGFIEINTILGEKIYSSEFTTHNKEFAIDIRNQPSGIYIVSIHFANQIFNKKLIINH